MTAAPRRRWFRFGLRTLLVIVTLTGTLYAAWLGWQERIVQERNELRAECERIGWVFMPATIWGPAGDEEIPLIRQLLGDHSIKCVSVPGGFGSESEDEIFPPALMDRIDKVFPESLCLSASTH